MSCCDDIYMKIREVWKQMPALLLFHPVHMEAMSKGATFSSISVRHVSCQPYIILFEAVSAPATVQTAYLPAGCGLGQIKSLIHEGVRVGRGADWKSRTKTKKLQEIGRGEAKVWVQERMANVK